MAANTTPIFPNVPNAQQTQISVANTARDGTGTAPVVWTPGTNGSLLSKIVVQCPITPIVADMVRLFWNDGTNKRLYKEILVAALTPSNTVAVAPIEFIPDTPEVYPTGWTLLAATNVGQITNVLVIGSNY